MVLLSLATFLPVLRLEDTDLNFKKDRTRERERKLNYLNYKAFRIGIDDESQLLGSLVSQEMK